MGILSDDLVKKAQKYLDAEEKIKNNPLVKEILIVFPNCTLHYKEKE